MTRHRLEIRGDFVERIRTSPTKALAELIWNSLDADATEVNVDFERSALGGIDAIEVRDNGSGMTHEQAIVAFGWLGGSWKDIEKESRRLKRRLHGRQGRGRLLAFSLRGTSVRWTTIAEAEEGRKVTQITVSTEDRDFFDVSDPEATSERVGTVVRIAGITEAPSGIEGEKAWLQLVGEFALYIEQYKPLVQVGGRVLDPAPLQADRSEYEIESFDEVEPPHLTIVEWTIPVSEVMYLCDAAGIALDFTRIAKPAPGFEFTAYLRWHGIEERSADLALLESGAHPVLSPLVEAARAKITEHFAERQRAKARTVIEEWQRERVYPYEAQPAGVVETATRDLFEVVAVAAAPAVNASENKQSRRFALSLLRRAVESEPDTVEDILQEVLDLTPEQREEFRHLIRRTSLAAIIKASRSITDRLDFLAALRIMVFDAEVKNRVLERSELHRILENETWIFGEQFGLTASDKSLTAALVEHVKILGREELAPPPEVLDDEGHRRILDLMLARQVPHARKEHEHLVVELKAPKVVVGDTEITQIKNYARAVARDPRFDRLQMVQWDFVIVSTRLTEGAESDASQTGRERGLVWEQEGIRVWVRTWAEIIDDAEFRLNFVKERLGYAPTDELALDYLRRTHAEFVPEPLRDAERALNRTGSDGDSIALKDDGVHERANPSPPVPAAVSA
jgi:hypothetical protein